ncbi:MAG: ribokinase [Anaerolineae bacterium]|nr:ribokinase [Anaerolineae bacterium]
MNKVIVLGSINMDVVVTAERHPQLGETIFGNELNFFPGGKGNNQAVAAKRLGGDVQLVGRLGDDSFGKTMHEFLQSEGLNLDHLRILPDAPTGTALITVNADSENTIIVVSGANRRFHPDELESVALSSGDVLVSQFEVPQESIRALFRRAQDVGAVTILNPAPAEPFIEGLQSLVSVLVVNETELAFFANIPLTEDQDMLIEAARKFRTEGQIIVVTLGKRGLLCIQDDQVIEVEGRPVHAVDTTGAGDCFVGALAVALSEKMELATALDFANHAASISVQRMGAATSLPHRSELSD